jgi:enediyne biosynthesis protein E4
MKLNTVISFLIACFCFFGCNEKKDEATIPPQFRVLDSRATGLGFSNILKPQPDFNMLKYMYYYNGAGVGAADFNNDGKIDLFFASSQGQNTLYLNEGKMHFRDVTKDAHIPEDGAWSTGVSVVDINNDGMQDIYVCRVGKFKILRGKNQLLVCKKIENGIPVYEEEAEKYGLGFSGFSTQASFLDYDLDGDLDMFLLNHSVNHEGNYAPRENFIGTYDSLAGDKFYKNENGHFTDVTKQCGINSSKIGYGLGIAVSDINIDGWPDIYIGNDFHENDYLYINQHDGTFKEELNEHIMHTSQFSMGVDVADINNDAYPDIVSLDMLPDNPYTLKRSLGEDDYQTFQHKLTIGYNYQYARNNLQLNRCNGMFSETAFYSGISATDWSWGALWMDFDNDGKKDLFISNGIPKRLNDIDYINYLSSDLIQDKIENNRLDEKENGLIEKFPEIKIPNRFFQNKGNAKFEDIGRAVPGNPNTFSNGTVYADLDNDGDLDIVVNNITDPALIYENLNEKNNYHTDIKLKGPPKNPDAVGAKVFVFNGREASSFENFFARGFLSSINIPLHLGFGNPAVDSAFLIWPDNTFQKINWDSSITQLSFAWKEKLPVFDYSIVTGFNKQEGMALHDITPETGLDFRHKENDFNEFNRETLLLRMFGTEGPALAVGDINNDGFEDLFIGSSKWEKCAVYFQTANGKFKKSNQPEIDADSTYEDVDAAFEDINNDGFKDLVIAAGGNEFYANEKWMMPRAYLNDGKGNMKKSAKAFPQIFATQSCIKPCDFNGDGCTDFFIGGRAVPFSYGKIPASYLLLNDGAGHFADVTEKMAKGLQHAGFVTNAAWADIDNNRKQDLIITLEWGNIVAFTNNGHEFVKKELTDKNGFWNFVLPVDIDGDGDMDLIAGNHGQNSRLQASAKEPVRMYYNDFDNNGKKEQVITHYQQGREISIAGKMDLEKQMPFIKKKFLYGADFAKATVEEIFGKNKLKEADLFMVDYLSSAVLINDGKGNFGINALPWQAQLSCLRDAIVVSSGDNELPDIFIAGNFYEQAIQLNRSDADFGTMLVNKGKGNFTAECLNGFALKNEVRRIRQITINSKPGYILTRNNESVVILQ